MTVRILRGDVRTMLATLPDASVQMCVTSPPYWGLRSYLPEGHPGKVLEIGSEPTVDEWVDTMVVVFREVRRVLKDDGVLFLNLGDSYASTSTYNAPRTSGGEFGRIEAPRQPNAGVPVGLKAKDLIGQPWMVAFALRADGWWLRQEIIWYKPGPMPESTRDRCTKAHEHVFLLSKRERYFWNFDAVQEPVSGGANARGPGNKSHKGTTALELGDEHHRTKGGLVAYAERQREKKIKQPDGWDTGAGAHGSVHREGRAKGATVPDARVGRRYHKVAGENPKTGEATTGVRANQSWNETMDAGETVETRNPRSVWTIPSEPFRGSHYATYPTELARRCIQAGSREGDTVLDPFMGSGTTGLAADRMHRHCIGIDLDERNVPMAHERIVNDAPLFAVVE